MTKKFIPIDFTVPDIYETNEFRLRMLMVQDVIKDYDAVMSSIEYLQQTKPFGPNNTWPTKDLTLEQDLIDLGWHQKEFQRKSSFAYTVIKLDETDCLGCMYIYPSSNPKYDAMIIMWVRQSESTSGLDEILFSNVKNWINDEWPFNNVAYPGKDVSWDEFE